MNIILGITGKAGVGKDTLAGIFVDVFGFKRDYFARSLKEGCKVMFGLTQEQLEDRGLKEKVIPFWGMSPRKMMQLLGTEAGRNVFGEDVWVKSLINRIEQDQRSNADNLYVISDVRFENEAEAIRNMGGYIVHLKSDILVTTSESAHASEAGIQQLPNDFEIINNGTVRDLTSAAAELLVQIW